MNDESLWFFAHLRFRLVAVGMGVRKFSLIRRAFRGNRNILENHVETCHILLG